MSRRRRKALAAIRRMRRHREHNAWRRRVGPPRARGARADFQAMGGVANHRGFSRFLARFAVRSKREI